MTKSLPLEDTASRRPPGRGRIYASITETIGDTPLVRLDKIAKAKGVGATLLAKLEFFNPIWVSVKDPHRRSSMIDVPRARQAGF